MLLLTWDVLDDVISQVILFNMLVAMMASTYHSLEKEAAHLSNLLWAAHIIQITRRMEMLGLSNFLRSGKMGGDCGGRPETYYKVGEACMLVTDPVEEVMAGRDKTGKKRMPRYLCRLSVF